MWTFLKKILTAPFILLAAIFVILEDWLWDDLLRLAAWLGQLPILRPVERFISGLPPYGALGFFATPSILLVPVKLTAVWFISHGQASLGVATAIIAKIVGTALIARIYSLTETKLLQISWFAKLHGHFVTFKQRVYAKLKATALYQTVHAQKLRIKTRWQQWRAAHKRSFLHERWLAAQRLIRKRQRNN